MNHSRLQTFYCRGLRGGTLLALVLAQTGAAATTGPVVRYEHDVTVLSAFLSPDSKHLATVCRDGSVHIWQRDKHERRLAFRPNDDHLHVVRFSPDSKIFVMERAGDPTIRIWGLVDDRWRRLRRIQVTEDRGFLWNASTFSPNSEDLYVAFTIRAKPGTAPLQREGDRLPSRTFITKWDIATGQFVRSKIAPLDGFVTSTDITPAAETIFVSLWDKMLVLDTITGERRRVIETTGYSTAVFSTGGRYVCISSTRGVLMPDSHVTTTVDLWRYEDDRLERLSWAPVKLQTRAMPVFSPDAARLATVDRDDGVRIVRVKDGTVLKTIPQSDSIQHLKFIDIRTLVAVGVKGKEALVWTIDEWR